eukprot:TRINITY_DN19090_c0_g1_i1.p1 TRINITY_DN19090_c0_g1~~TRINITY_DN19090_c0_g1_i1.p1  ORF type:complete len:302 (+),score=28.16 TRINITY_DN19090_c0_g1_i1:68-907(+)
MASMACDSNIYATLKVGCHVRCIRHSNPSNTQLQIGRSYEVVGWHTDSGTVVGTVNQTKRGLVAVRIGHEDRNCKTGWWNVSAKDVEALEFLDSHVRLRLKHMRHMSEAFEKLAEFHDVAIHVEDDAFAVSSVVLSSASTVFRRMLSSRMKEGITRQVLLQDTCASAVRSMLHFIVYGELQCASAELPEVVRIADSYDLPLLLQAAADQMSVSMTKDTVVANVRMLHQLSYNRHAASAYKDLLKQVQSDREMIRTLVDGLCPQCKGANKSESGFENSCT